MDEISPPPTGRGPQWIWAVVIATALVLIAMKVILVPASRGMWFVDPVGKIYHDRENCQKAETAKKQGIKFEKFKSRTEVKDAGYRACGICVHAGIIGKK